MWPLPCVTCVTYASVDLSCLHVFQIFLIAGNHSVLLNYQYLLKMLGQWGNVAAAALWKPGHHLKLTGNFLRASVALTEPRTPCRRNHSSKARGLLRDNKFSKAFSVHLSHRTFSNQYSHVLPNKPRHAADPELYEREFRRSLDNPEEFWAEAAEQLHWNKKWDKVLDDSNSPFTKW